MSTPSLNFRKNPVVRKHYNLTANGHNFRGTTQFICQDDIDDGWNEDRAKAEVVTIDTSECKRPILTKREKAIARNETLMNGLFANLASQLNTKVSVWTRIMNKIKAFKLLLVSKLK